VTGPGPLVLVVEDEPPVRRFLRAALGAHGYRVVEAGGVREAEQLAPSHNPDVFLLDLGLPDGDGVDLARRLREWSRAPIIVLSARGREEDKVNALDAGADDYLTKPFGVNELLARLRVALRHAQATPEQRQILEAGPLRIDLARRAVTVNGDEVRLTPTEYRVFLVLV
jgi:two-component system, OmpR family, KDP operon response regulator KdpE